MPKGRHRQVQAQRGEESRHRTVSRVCSADPPVAVLMDPCEQGQGEGDKYLADFRTVSMRYG